MKKIRQETDNENELYWEIDCKVKFSHIIIKQKKSNEINKEGYTISFINGDRKPQSHYQANEEMKIIIKYKDNKGSSLIILPKTQK